MVNSSSVIPVQNNAGVLQKRNATFATTHWSVVLRAGNLESPQAAEALQDLCRAYWYPLYAFVRAHGYGPDEAEDLTQGFFERLLEKNLIHQANRDRGRFRSFLLTLLKHYVANEWKRVHREKRAGRLGVISFDQMDAEERYRWEPVETATPESIYERRWTLTLMNHVLSRLRREYRACEKEALFDRLKSTLLGENGARTYSALGAECNMTEGAVTMAVHRLRLRYRELLLEEICHTVAEPSEVEDEIHHMIATLTG